MKVGILYVGIANVDELAYDAYVLGADTVWTPIRVHDTEAYMFYSMPIMSSPIPTIL